VWSGKCVVVSELCDSSEVYWQVLWFGWLPVGCVKCVGVSVVCAVIWGWLF